MLYLNGKPLTVGQRRTIGHIKACEGTGHVSVIKNKRLYRQVDTPSKSTLEFISEIRNRKQFISHSFKDN